VTYLVKRASRSSSCSTAKEIFNSRKSWAGWTRTGGGRGESVCTSDRGNGKSLRGTKAEGFKMKKNLKRNSRDQGIVDEGKKEGKVPENFANNKPGEMKMSLRLTQISDAGKGK